ncbi:MAG TPA: fibronectin type III domain-containing protein [Streptosporangiaceae bacterium]
MTEPDGTAQDPSVAAAAAAPQTPVTAPDLVTGQAPPTGMAPPTGQAPATAAPRRRRRWPVVLLAAVVVLGLVVWAPWTQPPVLRPTGLVAGPATANSVTFHWSRPRTGPLPDKYLVIGVDAAGGAVAGTVTSYRQTGLTPATIYQYQVVAVRDGKRSPESALLTVRTLTPPVSQARLQGSWSVHARSIGPAPPGRRTGYLTWNLSPVCAAGACDVTLHGKDGQASFKGKLTRRGATYTGRAVAHFSCGSKGNSIPYPVTLKIRIHPTKATGENVAWVATSFAGHLVLAFQFASNSAFYCPATTINGVVKGTPA